MISKLFVPVAQVATGIFTGGTMSPAAAYGIGYGIEGLGGVLQHVFNFLHAPLKQAVELLAVHDAHLRHFYARIILDGLT